LQVVGHQSGSVQVELRGFTNAIDGVKTVEKCDEKILLGGTLVREGI